MVFTKCEGNSREFQHALVIADMHKKKMKKLVRKTHTELRKV